MTTQRNSTLDTPIRIEYRPSPLLESIAAIDLQRIGEMPEISSGSRRSIKVWADAICSVQLVFDPPEDGHSAE